MEVKERSRKRELIKTAAIIFLAVMLLLTFFSRTIMNRSLPEVSTQLVTGGTINAKIRGSGAVTADETYEVTLDQTREVRSVLVKAGDTVSRGDLLIVLEDAESQELADAQDALSALEISYQKQLLELSKGYESGDLTVKQLREDLQKAISKRDANALTDEESALAGADSAATETLRAETAGELTAVQSGEEGADPEIDARRQAAEDAAERVAQAQTAVSEAQSDYDSAKSAAESAEKALDELETAGTVDLERAAQDAKSALDKAQSVWQSDWLAYRDTVNSLISRVDGVSAVTGSTHVFTSTERQYIEAYISRQDLAGADGEDADYARMRTAYLALAGDQDDVDAAQTAYDRAVESLKTSADSSEDLRNRYERALTDANAALRSASQRLSNAKGILESEQEGQESADGLLRSAVSQRAAELEALEKQYAAIAKKQGDYETALTEIESGERALENALSGKDIEKQMDDLDLQSARLEIEKQQELVEKYRTASVDTEIVSNVSGVVSAVNVSAGKEAGPGTPLMTIDVTDRGYTVKISVTAEQARQVKVGDSADVTNYYWGNNITATLESIAPDPDDPGRSKLLVFRIDGDVDAGTTLSLSVGQRSATYDCIIPKSALRSDTNGSFVLVLTSRSTPLGSRYTATRMDVQVLAEDDSTAAVSGLSPNTDYVITTSSAPLEAGTQVRMVESQ